MLEMFDSISAVVGISSGWLVTLLMIAFLVINKDVFKAGKLITANGAAGLVTFVDLGATNIKRLVNLGAKDIIDLITLAENVEVSDLLEVIENQKFIDKNEKFGQPATPAVKEGMNNALKQAVKKNK